MARTITALIPPHVTYVEPFCGGAQVFFHKPRSKVEILNDIDDEVVNFLRVCRRHPLELSRELVWQPASRRLFEWHDRSGIDGLTDIQRAARFFYLQRYTWSGHRKRRNFKYTVASRLTAIPTFLEKRFAEVSDRLQRVQLESASYEEVLKRYDRPTTFFYLDPPYVGVNFYEHNFSDSQFEHLAGRLALLKGRFLLSINDCEKTRHWFQQFQCREVSCVYTSMRTPRRFRELLFANYALISESPAILNTRPIDREEEQQHQ